MKKYPKINKKTKKRIFNLLFIDEYSLDKIHEIICSELHLYGVKYFGHGTPYQKKKVELLWKTILQIRKENKSISDFKKEISKIEKEIEDNEGKNGLYVMNQNGSFKNIPIPLIAHLEIKLSVYQAMLEERIKLKQQLKK